MPNDTSIHLPADELKRGRSMEVRIELHLESPVKVRGIQARFHGAEETKATYTTTTISGKGQVTTTTHTAVEQVSVVEQKHLFAGREQAGWFANLVDAVATLFGGGRHLVMPAGAHEYLVEVAVPADVPATHTGHRSRVFYELTCSRRHSLGPRLESYPFVSHRAASN